VRLVLQRVREAAVTVGGEVVGAIGPGLLVLAGVARGDTSEDARTLAAKVATLRMFEDAQGKTNLSLLDVGGAALVVSQSTLLADTRKGRRPSFTAAAAPDGAEALVAELRQHLEEHGLKTAGGRFGAHMLVSLTNDGPFTLVLDSRPAAGPQAEGGAGERG